VQRDEQDDDRRRPPIEVEAPVIKREVVIVLLILDVLVGVIGIREVNKARRGVADRGMKVEQGIGELVVVVGVAAREAQRFAAPSGPQIESGTEQERQCQVEGEAVLEQSRQPGGPLGDLRSFVGQRCDGRLA
jgi:hypothetical protein